MPGMRACRLTAIKDPAASTCEKGLLALTYGSGTPTSQERALAPTAFADASLGDIEP
jgi:hypothetical protein